MGVLKSKSTFRASTYLLQGVRYQIVSSGGHQVKVHVSGIHLPTASGQITDRKSWGSSSQSPRFGHPLTICKWPGTRLLVMGGPQSQVRRFGNLHTFCKGSGTRSSVMEVFKVKFRASTYILQPAKYQNVSHGGPQSQNRRFGHPHTDCKPPGA